MLSEEVLELFLVAVFVDTRQKESSDSGQRNIIYTNSGMQSAAEGWSTLPRAQILTRVFLVVTECTPELGGNTKYLKQCQSQWLLRSDHHAHS